MSKSYLIAGVTLLVGVVGVGCGEDGDDDVAHSNESVGTLCERTCERAVAKRCGGTNKDSCESQCNQTAAAAPAVCASAVNAFLTCTSRASYSCDAPTGRADAVGCLDTFEQMKSCSAANPSSTGSVGTPDAGTGTSDAGVFPSDAGAKPSGLGTSPVGVGGGSTGGSDAGLARPDAAFPVLTGGSDAGSSEGRDAGPVRDAGGGSASFCAAEADDDVCATCGKTKCCAAVTACVSDASCAKLGECVSACETLDCQQACANAATDGALDKFNASIRCYTDSCEAECAGDDTDGMPGGDTPNNGEPEGCLPTGVPDGVCTEASHPVGHECTSAPGGDCVLLPDVADVYCCAK